MSLNATITYSPRRGSKGGSGPERPFPPLVQRLLQDRGWPLVNGEELEALVRQTAAENPDGAVVLFCAGDHERYPQVLDVAVVLPELVTHFDGRLQPAVAARAAEEAFARRFGFHQWPSLVFLRGERHLGTISRMQDWQVYLARIRALLDEESDGSAEPDPAGSGDAGARRSKQS